MKNTLLFCFLFLATLSFSQNQPPVANNDTLILYYDEIHDHDSIKIIPFDWQYNDYDVQGGTFHTDTVFYSGINSISIFKPAALNYVLWITYFAPNNFIGTDSIQYIIKDNGNPVMYDTAMIYIEIKPQLHAILDANNIAARVDKFSLFSNYPSGPGFEAPKGSGTHSIFSANLWVAGLNGIEVHSSVKTFGHVDNSSSNLYNNGSNSGPVSNISNQYAEFNEKWDRVWKVKQYEIDFHLANWNSSNYNPPQSLIDWPAHGDITLGEAFMLAPFFDYDQDGIYDPFSGDYPIIKGDQAIYFIYNDGGSSLSSNPMTSEVHGMAYAFHCQDSALQNTIFVDYRIINRSTHTYNDTYFGMWTDGDLGNGNDDYVQCDVDRSLFYFFNGDPFDDDANGRPGYGAHQGAQGILTLKGAKQDADGQDNAFGIGMNQTINGNGFGDGVSDNEYWGMERFTYYNNGPAAFGGPQIDSDFYNFMRGHWKDGSPIVYGGNGHPNDPSSTNIGAKFMFPGTSDSYSYGTNGTPVLAWDEVTAQNSPEDRRGISASGPVTFAPGDEIELTYAFVFGRDYVNTGAQAGVTNMLQRADSIRSYYNQGMLSACGFPVSVNNQIKPEGNLVIYPNPTKGLIHIRQVKAMSIQIQILDITGKILLVAESNNQLNTIDLSSLTNGIYLVKVSKGNRVYVEKIIKN